MRREPGDVARFAWSAVVFALIVVGVPLGLAAVSRRRFGSANPLAGVDAPWQWFADGASTLRQPLADAAVTDGLIRVSLCLAWAAVVVIAVTTVLEVMHLLRHRGVAMPEVRGLGWAHAIARSIAVGIVVLVQLPAPPVSVASTMSELSLAVGPPDVTGRIMQPAVVGSGSTSAIEGHRPTNVQRAPLIHVVRQGESVYSIAEAVAASSGREIIDVADALIDANLGRSVAPGQRFTNPAYLEVGWELRIPPELVTATSAVPMSVDPVVAETSDRRVVVEPGDTLWDIAEEELGDPHEWTDIWHANAGRDMGDGRTFDDPNLILPGWELHVVDEFADEARTSSGDGSDVEAPAVGTGASTTDANAPVADEASDDPVSTPAPTATAPASVEVFPTTTITTAPVGGEHSDPVDDASSPPPAPSPVRLEHAALLAAGVLALVGVRRRRRMRTARPRHRVPEPRADLVHVERRLRAIDPGERTLRIDVACRAAAAGLVGSGAQIGWIVASADGDITLRLTAPAELASPWSGHGHDWVLGAEIPVETLSDEARRVGLPCVALFQLGVTPDGDDVLIDLEACGTLAVDAPPAVGDEIARAAAAGLASSIWAETAQLIAVALPTEALLGHRNTHQAESATAALRMAAHLVGTTAHQERSTFELRSLRTGGEAWEPAVVLVGSEAAAPTESPAPGCGIAMLAAAVAGELPDAPVRLVGSTGRWSLHGFDATLDLAPIGLSVDDVVAIDAVLADAERPLVEVLRWVDDPDDGRGVHVNADHGLEPAASESDAPPYAEAEHAVVVRLLGSVEVVAADGSPGRFERSKTVELIAWLATHRDRSTRSGARAALWELDVRDATFANVVSEARRGLGRLVAPPEGTEWVERTLTDQLPLHPLVVTDADLVEARLAAARLQAPQQALTTLRPAVEMIRDMPFAGTSYLWPDAEGITSNLVLLAISAATEYARHALSLGDIDGVFWATGRGLAVLSGHEELIGLRMRAHACTGDLAGVRQEWESYERVLVADAWSDGEPAPKLVALRHELLSP